MKSRGGGGEGAKENLDSLLGSCLSPTLLGDSQDLGFYLGTAVLQTKLRRARSARRKRLVFFFWKKKYKKTHKILFSFYYIIYYILYIKNVGRIRGGGS